MRRLVVVGGAASAVAAVAAAGLAFTTGGSPAAEAATENGVPATTSVKRRDLVLRDDVDGTLGYADARTLATSTSGTVTRLAPEGRVVTRGRALYEVDAKGVRLLYGTMPLWRRLAVGSDDGRDVEQLERNLVELGHDPDRMTIDEEFDSDTAAAVRSWQDALGLAETGAIELGDVVFLPGPRRVGQHETSVGAQLQPGTPVLQVTGTAPVVEIDLDARDRELARVGAGVRVELPSGRTVAGSVKAVGLVAETATTAQGEVGDPTVAVTVQLADPGRRDGLDGAPVTVSLERERAKGVLAVPVEALLALRGEGQAVELVAADGTRSLVAVETGTFADGYVEVEGRALRTGARMVVPE